MTRRRRVRLTAAVAAATLLTACTSPSSPPEDPAPDAPAEPSAEVPGPRNGGTLRIAIPDDPATLDPRFIADDEGESVVDAVFEPLVRIDPRGEVVPGAATTWEVGEDGREFTFELREQTFHDGTPVTADDFVRTFRRIADGTADPPSFLAFLLEPVAGAAEALEGEPLAGVEAVDRDTLRIVLDDPHPRFLLTLADPSLVPVPAAADDDPEAFAARPIGNGPFALAEDPEPGGFVRLTAVVDHHRRPSLDEVVFRSTPGTWIVSASGRTSRTGCCRSPICHRTGGTRPPSATGRPPMGGPDPVSSMARPRPSTCWGST